MDKLTLSSRDTEVKDKNGVCVYEGDILTGFSKPFGKMTGIVSLSKYEDCEGYNYGVHFGWNVNGIPLIDLINDGFKVIGNIHDNPQLLEEFEDE